MKKRVIINVQRGFDGYGVYWTNDWYRRHAHRHYWRPSVYIGSSYWWRRPSWGITWGWFDGYRPYYYNPTYYSSYVYTQTVPVPVYYNYGDNVVYDGDMVYVNGVPYVSADKYYEQSLELAQRGNTTTVIQVNPTQGETVATTVDAATLPEGTVVVDSDGNVVGTVAGAADTPALPALIVNSPTTAAATTVAAATTATATTAATTIAAKPSTSTEVPANQSQDPSEQWMPLGTFAILQDEEKGESSQVVQLAMNRGGIVRGNLYDQKTDELVPLEGAVDQETQRVAFRIASSETDDKSNDGQVFECGLWNLTQDSLPVLLHKGSGKQETKKFVRLTEDVNESEDDDSSSTTMPTTSPATDPTAYPPSSNLKLDLDLNK